MPDEIKKQIRGGDTSLTDKTVWADFNDIYGITSDLKVYYCGNSNESRLGATDEEIKADLSDSVTGMQKDSDWANALGLEKDVTYKDLLNVDELTINNNSLNLKLMYNLGSLRKLTFENVDISNLDGIDGATNLEYVFFYNCKIGNYKDLSNCNKLKNLYFQFLSSMSEQETNEEISKLCDSKLGIAEADLKNLEYFGIFGIDYYIKTDVNEIYIANDSRMSNLTDISPLNNLNSKKYIKYIFLNNNRITSLDPLKEYTSLYQIKLANCKKLNNLNGLQNLPNLAYVYSQYCDLYDTSGLENCRSLYYLYVTGNPNLTTLNKLENSNKIAYIYANNCALGKNENSEESSSEDALCSIKHLGTLQYINLENNDLKRVEYLNGLSNLNNLYLLANENINSKSLLNIRNVINACGSNFTISSKYSLILLDINTKNLSLEDQSLNKDNFILLKDKINIVKLNLKNLKLLDNNDKQLSDDEFNQIINEVLSTLTAVRYLNLSNLDKLNDISFAKNMAELKEIVLYGTNVITDEKNENGEYRGLELLQNNTKLISLAIDNENIDLAKIVPVIKNLGWAYAYNTSSFLQFQGLFIKNENILKTLNKPNLDLEQLTLTDLKATNIVDLSQCTSLKRLSLIYGLQYKVKAPDSVTYLYLDGQILSGEYPEQLEEIYGVNNCLNDYVMKNLADNCPNLKAIKDGNSYDISNLTMLENSKFVNTLETIYLVRNNTTVSGTPKINSISSLKNYINLKELTIENANISSLEGIENLKKLTKLSLKKNKITSVESLSEDTNLQEINLSDNKIYSLYGIENLKQLKYLNIENNCLQDIVQYTDKNNVMQTIRNLSIIKNLNENNGGSLNTILLNGNINLADFSEIQKLSWKDKSGF